MAKGKSILLGLVVGGVIGAGATLLSTPKSGKDLRLRVQNRGLEWKEMLQNIKNDSMRLKEKIVETSKEGATMITQLTKEMKESIKEWKGAVEPHQENIQQYLEQIETSLKDLENKVSKQNNN